jgi:DNA-binding SARP family transcriptional activator/tetratricopeptide (TPR) repeat protein
VGSGGLRQSGLLWFRVLGPVGVWRDGVEVDLGAPQQRTVLAVLLARVGLTVSVDEIVDAMWGEDPPGTAVNAVQRSVGLLRRALEPELATRDAGRWLIRSGRGYRLALDAETVDLLRFRQLVTQARSAGDAASGVEAIGAALDLWRGPAANGIDPRVRDQAAFIALDREYLATAREAADLALAAGNAERVLPALRLAAARGPFDEPVQGRLIRLLAAAGHQAEALEVYEVVRRRLADELGIDPGAELTAARDGVLSPGVAGAAAPVGVPVPAQLPADLAVFTGRRAELARALALPTDRVSAAETVVITAIGGMAGIGKTSLAVRWAHQIADRFPDGQLYLNLRGFDPAGQVVGPGDALVTLLDGLGVSPARVPTGVDARAALYRSRIAGRKMLVLLDNARDAGQVRPLLPGSAGCLVIVTSRNQLTSLVAVEGAHLVTLDLLSAVDAVDFLARRLGVDRVGAEPDAVADIVALCGGLPLALAIAAARAATHPGFGLAAIAGEMGATERRLDAFAGPDPAINARTVFSWSYTTLSPGAARLFRLLGLTSGPDISSAAAASLAGVGPAEVRMLLAELTAAHLVSESAPGRYTSHDLVRAYAAELSGVEAGDGRLARHRLLDHYVHTAHAGSVLISPVRAPITLVSAQAGVTAETLVDVPAAVDWFTAEQAVLVDAISLAAEHGFDHHVWQLQWAASPYLVRRASPDVSIVTLGIALDAVVRLGDRTMQARILDGLGQAHARADQPDQAVEYQRRALALSVELGNRSAEANIQLSLAKLAEERGAFVEALHYSEQAHEIFVEIGNDAGTGFALAAIGSAYYGLREPLRAIDYNERAILVLRDVGDVNTEASAWVNIGQACNQLGEYSRASAVLCTALELARRAGDRVAEALALEATGDAQAGSGDYAAGRASWELAYHTLSDVDERQAAQLSRKLHGSASAKAG